MTRTLKFIALGPALLGALVHAAPTCAQVIEVGDDGTARTYSGPTRFVTGDARSVERVAEPVEVRSINVDSFERAAKAEKIDVHLLRAVAWTESRGRAGAVSPKGALGIMQLMPGTAAELGVDPLDVDSNISGGARYLARQLTRFQTVPLALAAYNSGPGAVVRWGGIPPYAETKAYVASIMARWAKSVPVGTATRSLPTTTSRPKLVAAKNSPATLLIEVPPL